MKVTVSEQKGNELITNIRDGIIRKLQSTKRLVDSDKEVAAGLYTYTIEEFGKLLLMKDAKSTNNQYEINSDWFVGHKAHDAKFTKEDHLEANNHENCYVLNDEGGFDPKSFSWKGFDIGLIPDFEARLSIFYSGFKAKGNNDIDIIKIPNVDRNMLANAINEFEKMIIKFL